MRVCSRGHEPTSLFARPGVIFLKFRRELTGFSSVIVGICGSVTIQPHWRRAVSLNARLSGARSADVRKRDVPSGRCLDLPGEGKSRQSTGAGNPGPCECARSSGASSKIGFQRSSAPHRRVAQPKRPDALHAGNASAGVAQTSPYIEEASR